METQPSRLRWAWAGISVKSWLVAMKMPRPMPQSAAVAATAIQYCSIRTNPSSDWASPGRGGGRTLISAPLASGALASVVTQACFKRRRGRIGLGRVRRLEAGEIRLAGKRHAQGMHNVMHNA